MVKLSILMVFQLHCLKANRLNFLKTINGLERVEVDKFGYAVEYDCIDSSELKAHMKQKRLINFSAGQINGTTRYEEAAGQGLLSGNQRSIVLDQQNGFILERSAGYLGVLTSDLMRGGLVEPYRMFTSRAEYRLFLRAIMLMKG